MNYQKLQIIVRGFSNHRRIEILNLINSQEGISIVGISDKLNVNFKTIAEHTRRLADVGLVKKCYIGKSVIHYVTPLGKNVLTFLRTLE